MIAVPTSPSSNFGFLAEHDPNTSLIKLRQLGEALAQHLAALSGLEFEEQTTQSDLLYRLNRELRLEPQVRDLFHALRIEGNKATHQFRTRRPQRRITATS